MKLPIKKKYFDLIKSGKKTREYRDAHITFICEETGETLTKEITDVYLERRNNPDLYPDVLSDEWIIRFDLGETKEKSKGE